jgi:DNA-directed RNA polymerase specialized sigma subunit
MEGVMKLLKNYAFILDRITDLQNEINELWKLRSEYEQGALKSNVMTGMPHGSGVSDPTYNIVQKTCDEYLADILQKSDELSKYKQQRKEIEELFKTLDLFEYKIITLRYVRKLNFYEVGREIHYSKQRVCELHKTIIDKMENSVQTGQQNQAAMI